MTMISVGKQRLLMTSRNGFLVCIFDTSGKVRDVKSQTSASLPMEKLVFMKSSEIIRFTQIKVVCSRAEIFSKYSQPLELILFIFFIRLRGRIKKVEMWPWTSIKMIIKLLFRERKIPEIRTQKHAEAQAIYINWLFGWIDQKSTVKVCNSLSIETMCQPWPWRQFWDNVHENIRETAFCFRSSSASRNVYLHVAALNYTFAGKLLINSHQCNVEKCL